MTKFSAMSVALISFLLLGGAVLGFEQPDFELPQREATRGEMMPGWFLSCIDIAHPNGAAILCCQLFRRGWSGSRNQFTASGAMTCLPALAPVEVEPDE